jgi:electron transport complex protein RnfG
MADNKNSSTFKEIFIPTLVLFLIAGLVTLILALGNHLTKDKIAAADEKAKQDAMKLVVSDADDFKENDDYFIAYKGDEIIGYIFTTTTKGYGGDVSVMTGIDIDGKVTGVSILSESETAGLGKKANDKSFTDQYSGLEKGIEVTKDSVKGNEIKAITGATITSKAVTKAVNEAIDRFEEVA